jgi:hypothetical protein
MAWWWRSHQEVQSAIESFGADIQEDQEKKDLQQRESELVRFSSVLSLLFSSPILLEELHRMDPTGTLDLAPLFLTVNWLGGATFWGSQLVGFTPGYMRFTPTTDSVPNFTYQDHSQTCVVVDLDFR